MKEHQLHTSRTHVHMVLLLQSALGLRSRSHPSSRGNSAQDECVPHQKSHSVEPNGNPTPRASLATSTNPRSHQPSYTTPWKIGAVAMATDLFTTSQWKVLEWGTRAAGSDESLRSGREAVLSSHEHEVLHLGLVAGTEWTHFMLLASTPTRRMGVVCRRSIIRRS